MINFGRDFPVLYGEFFYFRDVIEFLAFWLHTKGSLPIFMVPYQLVEDQGFDIILNKFFVHQNAEVLFPRKLEILKSRG